MLYQQVCSLIIIVIITQIGQLKSGADPNARYFMGSEINLISILKVSSLKMLLEYGAHPDSRDRTGLTPLMKAARHPQGYAAVKLLIDHGADVNDIAGERHDYRTVLHHSIFSGNVGLIRLLLTSGARYPKLEFDKPSPLDIAIISGRSDIASLLIEFDADVNGGSHTTIGQPLHTALTQWLDNKREIVKLLLDNGANPNSCQTSNRNTGPPLHDYLHSAGRSSVLPSSARRHCTDAYNQPYLDIELVRLLLMYGARIILKTPTQHPFGLVRALERVQDEISLDILQLLIDAAEEIDWYMMSKVIYACLRRTNRVRTNELFDPSVAADMTPQLLVQVLSDQFAHYHGLCESLIKLLNGGNSSSAVLTLKQISRINLRRFMSDELELRGRQLVHRISCLPLPSIMIKYLLYQV